jgi:acyl-CoA synthetase (AMP-forming)/AMP-acid ligase II
MQDYIDQDGLKTEITNADRWLETGDIGKLSASGDLSIIGRKKEMYLSHGFSVYPAEVERLLLHSGMLAHAAIIAADCKFSGQQGYAFVVPKTPASFDLRTLQRWCRENMANYKVPGKFFIREDLPKTESGKIDKPALAREISAPAGK